jgi:hypothetical protein
MSLLSCLRIWFDLLVSNVAGQSSLSLVWTTVFAFDPQITSEHAQSAQLGNFEVQMIPES